MIALTKEERAHDLAVALITKIDFDKLNSFPDGSKIFDATKNYEHAYKCFLDSFEENF